MTDHHSAAEHGCSLDNDRDELPPVAQCGDTAIHDRHGPCPGLDGTEVAPTPTEDGPLSVRCPSCTAPPGVLCPGMDEPHADRLDAARIGAVEWGTCALCGEPLARLLDPLEVVHPNPDHAAVCPPMPPPEKWNDYAAAINAGLSPGHPGAEHFIPTLDALEEEGRKLASQRDDLIAGGANPADLAIPAALSDHATEPVMDAANGARLTPRGPLCPECAQGKVLNCAQQAMGADDELVPCTNGRANV